MRTGPKIAQAAPSEARAPVPPAHGAPPAVVELEDLAERLRWRGEEAGLAALGFAPATPMEATRRILEERKAAGLSGGMQFTYRNPARSTDPGRLGKGAATLVVGAWSYGPGPGESGDDGGDADLACRAGAGFADAMPRPTGLVARYARFDHYADLRTALGRVADVLERAGWWARVVADDNALVDRAAAHRAGLGWFGKNSNILLPGRGSWFLLGSVVTDAPLPLDNPTGDGCGSCRRCIGSCPTGALVAPGVLDARKCLAWLLQAPGVFPFEYRAVLGGRIYGCDDCQEVCPINRVASRTSAAGGPARAGRAGLTGQAEVDLLALLSAGDESLLARYGRWYIPQRDPRYLRRNALIALGNVADGRLLEVELALGRYLDGPDELLRAHAVWAALRAGRDDLVASRPGLAEDPSPVVRQELARRADVPARPGHAQSKPPFPMPRQ